MKRRTKFTCHLWLVTCHLSLVTCHMSLFKHFSILLESQGIRKYMTWYVTKILLHVTCHMSLVTCHVFLVKHLSILLESQGIRKYMTWYEEEENFTRQLSLVTCHLSLVTCHMSLVTCYLSHVYTKMYSWNHKELRKYWYVEVWKPILCCQAKWGTSSRGEVHSGGGVWAIIFDLVRNYEWTVEEKTSKTICIKPLHRNVYHIYNK